VTERSSFKGEYSQGKVFPLSHPYGGEHRGGTVRFLPEERERDQRASATLEVFEKC